jgi:hypothetical protein
VRLQTIRKRMVAKLRDIKQQLRTRMHDPVRQTGHWLKSIVQGHFNYYPVPGKPRQSERIPRTDNRAMVANTSPSQPDTSLSLGHVLSLWPTDGFRVRASSILIPQFALPLVIRDKNRKRE